LIAESDLNDPRLVRPTEVGGLGLDAQWSDDFHHALHAVITGERNGCLVDFGSIGDLAKAFENAFVYTGTRSRFRQRRHGRPPLEPSAHRFLGFIQNHDQIGNRAAGERLSHLIGVERAKLAAALVVTSPFVPMLFQGEEFAASAPFQFFADFPDDPALARLISEGRHNDFAAFGWKAEDVPEPGSPETFLRSKLDWSEVDRDEHGEMLQWYRKLIRLRRRLPQLTDGRLDLVSTSFSEDDQWLVVKRSQVTIAVNFAASRRKIPISKPQPQTVLLSTHDSEIDVRPESVSLPGHALVILGPEHPTILEHLHSCTIDRPAQS
jgi:maltooligosyltrehalose trehalohydrolase